MEEFEKTSLEELLELLKDDYNKTRRDAAYLLYEYYRDDPRVFEAWLAATEDDDEAAGTSSADGPTSDRSRAKSASMSG